jgi:hypothetical protein
MSITCVFFGGFHQRRLEGPNAFSVWIDHHIQQSDVRGVVLNMRMGNSDSLRSRWRRFSATHFSLWSSNEVFCILGYSMGCHLAVKFAAEPSFGQRVMQLCLIAPDPKFRPSVLDTDESAYEQARELWDSAGCPGDDLCNALNTVTERPTSPIQVIYSEHDTVALWEGNAEILKRRCDGKSFQWTHATINQEAQHEWFRVQLQPSEARGEFWIHEQLFTKLTKNQIQAGDR